MGQTQRPWEVVDVIKANKIEFEYGASGDSILVPEDQVANLRMELAMKGLPKVAMSDMRFSTKETLALVTLFSAPITPGHSKANWPVRFL